MIESADHSGHALASRLKTVMAETNEQKLACDALRQRVQEQQGIRHRRALTSAEYEQQLLVVNRLNGLPIATVGLNSNQAGGDIESEFDLHGLMQGSMDYLEIDGPVMLPGHNPNEVLTQCLGLIGGRYVGCMPQALVSRVSLPLGGGDKYVQSLMFYLRNSHMCTTLARPRVPLRRGDVAYADDVILPGMLRAFLRYGACIGSEPYWDAEQGRAEILVWLGGDRLAQQPYLPQSLTRCCTDSQLSA
jgi:hypothetical protein